jgi:hypothetical protein
MVGVDWFDSEFVFSNEEPGVARGVGEGPQDGHIECSRAGFGVKIDSASNDRSCSRFRVRPAHLWMNGIGLCAGATVPSSAIGGKG